MKKINISLLIAVHFETKAANLIKTINSISTQTHKPNEIILIKDGPIKISLNKIILNSLKKNSITKVLTLAKNKGLAIALNYGLKNAKHELIARLDPEDEIINNRFMLQYNYMLKNSKIVVCGGFALEMFNDKKKIIKKPTAHEDISKQIKFRNPFIHSSIIFRKKFILKIGGYPKIKKCQDLFLWIKCLEAGYKMANINLPLIKTYLNQGSLIRRNAEYFKYEKIIYEYQYKKNLITLKIYFFQIISRYILRNIPFFLKNLIYRSFR